MNALTKMYKEYLICYDHFLASHVEHKRLTAEIELAVEAFRALDVKKISEKEFNAAKAKAIYLEFEQKCLGIKCLAEATKVAAMMKDVAELQKRVAEEIKSSAQ